MFFLRKQKDLLYINTPRSNMSNSNCHNINYISSNSALREISFYAISCILNLCPLNLWHLKFQIEKNISQCSQGYWSHAPTTTIHQTLKKTSVGPYRNTFKKKKKIKKRQSRIFLPYTQMQKRSEKRYWQLQSVLHYKQTQKHLNKKNAQTQ